MKSVTRHVFDPFEDGAIFKSKFLRSKTKEELFAVLDRLNTDFYALEIKAKEAISSLST